MAFSIATPNLGNSISNSAFQKELERLKQKQLLEKQKSTFMTTAGQGIARTAEVRLGGDLNLQTLSAEERKRRATGKLGFGLGLVL